RLARARRQPGRQRARRPALRRGGRGDGDASDREHGDVRSAARPAFLRRAARVPSLALAPRTGALRARDAGVALPARRPCLTRSRDRDSAKPRSRNGEHATLELRLDSPSGRRRSDRNGATGGTAGGEAPWEVVPPRSEVIWLPGGSHKEVDMRLEE